MVGAEDGAKPVQRPRSDFREESDGTPERKRVNTSFTCGSAKTRTDLPTRGRKREVIELLSLPTCAYMCVCLCAITRIFVSLDRGTYGEKKSLMSHICLY